MITMISEPALTESPAAKTINTKKFTIMQYISKTGDHKVGV
jgi:hypothetical protein